MKNKYFLLLMLLGYQGVIGAINTPIAYNQSVTVGKNSIANDIYLTCSGVGILSFTIAANPTNGTLSGFDPVTGSVRYTPTSAYVGSDSFAFYVTNPDATVSNTATISLTVTNTPIAADQADLFYINSVDNDIHLTCTDPNGLSVTYTIATLPSHGTLSDFDSVAGTVKYTPNIGYQLQDSFTFYATNSSAVRSNTATFSIGIGLYDLVANSVVVNTAVSTPVTIVLTGRSPDSYYPLVFTVQAAPVRGTLSAITSLSDSTASVVYTPNSGYQGSDYFTFSVTDSTGAATLPLVGMVGIGIGINYPGILDYSFGTNGIVQTTSPGANFDLCFGGNYQAVAATNDRIILGGSAHYDSNDVTNNLLARYLTSDGALDSSFGNGGYALLSSGVSLYSLGFVLENNGKIVQAGFDSSSMLITRTLADGSALDSAFGTAGSTNITYSNSILTAMSRNTDGSLISAASYYSAPDNDTARQLLFKLAENGVLDTSFNSGSNGGFVSQLPATGFNALLTNKLVIDPISNRIYTIGRTYKPSNNNYYFNISKYTAAGLLDTSFNASGVQPGSVQQSFDSLFGAHVPGQVAAYYGALQTILTANDCLVVGGIACDSRNQFYIALARYRTNDGQLDNSFGTNGLVITPAWVNFGDLATGKGVGGFKGFSIAIEPTTNQIFISSKTTASDVSLVMCYNPDGTLNADFNSIGVTPGYVYNILNGIDSVNVLPDQTNVDLLFGSDGIITTLGSYYSFVLARFLLSGISPLPVFDTGCSASAISAIAKAICAKYY